MEDSVQTSKPAVGGFYANIGRQHGYEPLEIEGVIPPQLHGTLYRNGPAVLEVFGQRYGHALEADGGVVGVRFRGGQVEGAYRAVEPAETVRERAAGRPLYGSIASWPQRVKNGLSVDIKNAANTHVLYWQGRLFATHELSPLLELNPEDLSTIGETDLDGAIPFAMSSHNHVVAKNGKRYNFGIRYGARSSLDLFSLPEDGPVTVMANMPLDYPVVMHDFYVTDKHAIFFVAPWKVLLWRMALGLNPFEKLFRWCPEDGTEIITVSLDDPQRISRFRVPAFFSWHIANAYEDGDEIVADYIRYDNIDTFFGLGDDTIKQLGALHRMRINPATKTATDRRISAERSEYPRVDPRLEAAPHRVVFAMVDEATSSGHTSGIRRFDTHTGDVRTYFAPAGQRLTEPVFLPRDSDAPEGDGFLLVLSYDSATHRSFMAVYDTDTFEEGPIGRAWFDHHISLTYHGLWVPA